MKNTNNDTISNTNKDNNNYVAIMAGGVGSRFWPMSTSAYPKQFLDVLNTGFTLLQETYNRYLGFIPNENIYIVTNKEYVDIVHEQLPLLPKENIIGEVARKNTAPCVAYIASRLYKKNPDANLVIAPSDHLITDVDGFKTDCLQALNYTAEHDAFVTLGIKPTHPNTGYGYIQYEKSSTSNIFGVSRFTEKPKEQDAMKYLASGDYLWNAGIFIWKAADILSAFRTYCPDLYEAFYSIRDRYFTASEDDYVAEVFYNCESISIDYAVMEHAQNVHVIPAQFAWSDLGTWNSAWENSDKDENQNAVDGKYSLALNTKGCNIRSNEDKLVVVAGVEDLIIINTKDALLVCKKENEQEIKLFSQQAQAQFPMLAV